MIDLGLFVGHMVGDYIVQNDWMARNKANPITETFKYSPLSNPDHGIICQLDHDRMAELVPRIKAEYVGHLACTIHCLCYTLAVWACSFWWMPWWGIIACFLAHWPIDRFALAGRWMRNVSGQRFFASKEHPMWPNSVVLVDNTFHLLTLFIIGVVAGV